MKVDEKIIDKFNLLLKQGERLLLTKNQYGDSGGKLLSGYYVDNELSNEWATSSLNILASVFGKSSEHYTRFKEQGNDFKYFEDARSSLGVLKAAKNDYENGYLFTTRTLIEAEIFDEFIEQAEELFKKGYYQAAAIIAGCVLEDCLRKLCDKNSIALPPKATNEPMNVELAKAGIYNKLWQKKITALADLRNKAAHNLGGFTDKDVEDMIRDVRRFMEDYFS